MLAFFIPFSNIISREKPRCHHPYPSLSVIFCNSRVRSRASPYLIANGKYAILKRDIRARGSPYLFSHLLLHEHTIYNLPPQAHN